MNPISAFFVQNIIFVYFIYGLAFFVLGLALVFASRAESDFLFARAIRPMAAFGLLHGIHEWYEMFQKIALVTTGHTPSLLEEIFRLGLLVSSFVMLLLFALILLRPQGNNYRVLAVIVGIWLLGVAAVSIIFKPQPMEIVWLADVLARYALGIPASLLGAWALMVQQRTFREHDMPQFGRDLVWSATALFLYGVVGQIFVRETILFPSTVLNTAAFLSWFGIPVQLFRAIMAGLLAWFMVRALQAFTLESRRRLEQANEQRLQAQAAALEVERRVSQEMERLNEELRLTAHELSLLLDLSNLLAEPKSLEERLANVLDKIVYSLYFPDAGMILLARENRDSVQVQVSTGYIDAGRQAAPTSRYGLSRDLGRQAVQITLALCRHEDDMIIEFLLEEALDRQECRHYQSPTTMVALPLEVQRRIIGALVLARPREEDRRLMFDELKLMVGMVQQLGLSIEHARLHQEAQRREKQLANLLYQVVGAQEAERQRIARELHDATGQSLTAITLGLRGIEKMMSDESPDLVRQVGEVKNFGTDALGELRQIIADLRPPQLDELGLVAALKWYTNAFQQRRAIDINFTVEGNHIRLPSEYETVLFRITQETLTNIAKHAQASHVDLRLAMEPRRIVLTVQDDGIGFDAEAMLAGEAEQIGWGLMGIKERTSLLGGRYEIESSPGQGTQIHVEIPLAMDMEDADDTITTG